MKLVQLAVVITGIAMASSVADAGSRVKLEELDPPLDRAEYLTWLRAQTPAARAAIAAHCAQGYEPDDLCNGIGLYALEAPPPADSGERAAWLASLSPEVAAHVARSCAGPKHLLSTLCGQSLPAPPTVEVTYAAWLKKLTRNERGMVDDHCAAMVVGTDEYCDGIGPLHIPRPPNREAAMMPGKGSPDLADSVQAEWDAWYRGLTRAQKAYYRHWCTGENAGISELCGGTPLVVVFDDKPVEYVHAHRESRFAIDGMSPLRTDWPTARTPWIARDLDGDGRISDGRELFGSGTQLGDLRARDGFEALAALDDNRDGLIDARDRAFGELLLWSDRDGDRRGAGDELVPLASAMSEISLAATREATCDARGNCVRLRARAGLAAVVDIQLLVQPPSE